MKTVRPLARVPTFVEGESFVSYIDRLAAMHQVDLLVTLNAVGVIADERYERLNGFGVFLTQAQMDRFCTATRMPPVQASKMLMSSYDGTAIDLRGAKPGDSAGMRKLAMDEWAYFSGSHVCPKCVVESAGAWQLSWKLPWSFACTRHRCYLVPFCPGCTRRFNSGRRDRSLSPLFVRHVPTLGTCGNPRQFGDSVRGKGALACGQALADVPVIGAGRSTIELQKKVDEALAGVQQSVLGSSVAAREFFQDLRSLCALILYCAEAEDLTGISQAERSPFAAFALRRNETIAQRRESSEPRNGERIRVFIGPQEDPALMAATIRHALTILSTADLDAMATLLKPVAERCIGRTSKARWAVMDYFRFSERIRPAVHLSLAQKSTFNRAMGNRSLEATENRPTFLPDHVPQLLWEAEFEAHFSKFFPDVGNSYARRFCSMSLVKLCGEYTWGEAARMLGLPERPAIKLANRCVGFLNDDETKQRFSKVLHASGQRLSRRSDKIDYGKRREAFAGLVDIPPAPWAQICKSAGITVGQPGRRSKYAATWLWSHLTDGDWMLAPAMTDEDPTHAREVYRTMLKGVLLDCRGALIEYGASLLTKLDEQRVAHYEKC